MKYWLIPVSSAVRISFSASISLALPFIRAPPSAASLSERCRARQAGGRRVVTRVAACRCQHPGDLLLARAATAPRPGSPGNLGEVDGAGGDGFSDDRV